MSVGRSNRSWATKTCTACDQEKSVEDFGVKNVLTGLRQSYCKQCQREKAKAHYEANKTSYLVRNARRAEEVAKYVDELKAKTPCVDCGQVFKPRISDWHHKDSSTKLKIVSVLRHSTTLPAVLREIEKCDLLCANCHRERTFYG